MNLKRFLSSSLVCILYFFQIGTASGQSTYTVTNPNDSGSGSLREAMVNANTNPGLDTIQFDLGGGGAFDIKVLSNLPIITEAVVIDGFSQQGSIPPTENNAAVYIVVIDGRIDESGMNYGFEIGCPVSNCTIKGFTIQNFLVGVNVCGSNNRIEGNRLVNNLQDGVMVTGNNNIIGGSSPDKRNVMIYNNNGIDIFPEANGNIIEGNYVGIDDDGITAAPNNRDGVSIGSNYNRVANNIIGGQGYGNGILIQAWDEERIPRNNVITGNTIGLDKTGTTALPNGQGVSINHSDNNKIENNIIAFNNYNGVLISAQDFGWEHLYSTGNLISKNSIYNNGGLGIDLNSDWVTPNDKGDIDTGSNNTMNYPFITSAYIIGHKLVVTGTLDTDSPKQTKIELFANTKPDDTGYGEGRYYLGSDVPKMKGKFKVLLPMVDAGTVITATATDKYNNTSEFSLGIEVVQKDVVTGNSYDLYLYDTKKKELVLLSNTSSFGEYNSCWSHNGSLLVHDIVIGAANLCLGVTNRIKGTTERLENTEGGNDAVWSSGGLYLAFDDFTNIYLYSMLTNNKQLLVENAINPYWSDDGDKMVFQKTTDGSIRTITINKPDEETIVTYVNPSPYGNHPRWTSDGKWIVYYNDGIWKIRVNKMGEPIAEPVPLILNDGNFSYSNQNLSSDGKTIIFSSNKDTYDTDIWTMTINGEELTRITGISGYGDYDPAFSPNGRFIAFSGFTDNALNKQNAASFNDAVSTTGKNPHDYSLSQNYPNPFNPSTIIKYHIAEQGYVILKIYDMLGNEVATLVNGQKSPGYYEVIFDARNSDQGRNLASGVYVYQLNINGNLITKKMSLVR